MNLQSCSLLVHTFDRYQKYWPGFLKGFHKHFNYELPCYFGTDIPFHVEHDFRHFQVLYSGPGEWSDRLINLLNQIQTDYILYIQEDMWLTAEPPNLEKLLEFTERNNLWRLQISPVVQFYSLHGSTVPLYFHYKSKYLMSHQPSIWKKSCLLRCLKPNEDPWKNEYEATKRLNHEAMAGKIAIYPHNWFTHESVKDKQNT